MELTITYLDRTFTLRIDHEPELGYSAAIAELMPDGTVAHWDGSDYYDSWRGLVGIATRSIIDAATDEKDPFQ